MTKSVFACVSFIFLLASCKETPPPIAYGAHVVDTTYEDVNNIPAAQPHEVLIEEFTGQSCTACPAAHRVLEDLAGKNPSRLNIICLYYEGITQTKPPTGAKYDLRHAKAKEIANTVYGGVNSIPAGGVDRVAVAPPVIKLDKTQWEGVITERLPMATPVNIKLESRYNAAARVDSVRVTLSYTATVDYAHSLTLAVVEDSIIDKQEYPSTDPVHPGSDDNYVFTNVFRDLLTGSIAGDPILPAMTVKSPGRVVVRNYTYKVPDNFNPDNCRLIAFIASEKDKTLIHSKQTKMK